MANRQGNTFHLVSIAVVPVLESDRMALGVALKEIVAEDPNFTYLIDFGSDQTILKGESDRHLDSKIDRLKRTYAIEVKIGPPQVAYRETLTRVVVIDHTFKKQKAGSGQFARVKIQFEPLPTGSGFIFENEVVGGVVPNDYVLGVEKGLQASRENGVLAGYPVIDFKATLIDGAFHEIDSSEVTFEIATRAAFRELKELNAVSLLEPTMRVEVVTPDDFTGEVVADLVSRHGIVQGADQRGDAKVITAVVPLASMLGYTVALGRLSQERAQFTMGFDHYSIVQAGDDDPGYFPSAMAMRA
ncbi:MAG: hypothetical protein SGJ03_01970 [Alphaproteobacteria bacterium]|nr:hypothetical protein [Alphaproteobacteria bacterium]